MIVIGAADRNVGKTEFACALIRQYAPAMPVIAVKVTPVDANDGLCPRGGKGCGVCSSLSGDFCLTEEILDGDSALSGKDTDRMLSAGASHVYWLRVLRSCMEKGVAELLSLIPEDACVVCESNTVRTVIEPGAFIVLRKSGSAVIKKSCAAVIDKADRLVDFFGDKWNFNPERCAFLQGRWQVPMDLSAAILTGGKSSRMGMDKALLTIGGKTMLEHIIFQVQPFFDFLCIGANDSEKYAFTGLPVIQDEEVDLGPLMGILSCISASKTDKICIFACDVPNLPPSFIRDLCRASRGADMVLTVDARGRAEPFLSAYSKKLIPVIRKTLAEGSRRISDIFSGKNIEEFNLVVVKVSLEDATWYKNINTKDEYREISG